MRHSNWILKDTHNKAADLINVVRKAYKAGNIDLDAKIDGIHKVKRMNRKEVLAAWAALPAASKTHPDNLGCH